MAFRKNGSLRDAVTWKNVHGLLLVQESLGFFFFFFFYNDAIRNKQKIQQILIRIKQKTIFHFCISKQTPTKHMLGKHVSFSSE